MIGKVDLVDLISKLSLLLMLLYSGHYWFSEMPLSLLFIASFIFSDLQKSSLFWFAAFSIVFFEIIFHWHSSDNHTYLTAYWFLSMSLMLSRPAHERSELLRTYGRFYISTCMFFAVLWKLLSSDFISGDFFEYTLLTDDRFFNFTALLTDIAPNSLIKNQLAVDGIFSNPKNVAPLITTDSVRWLALTMSYFTIVIELAIMLSFLFLPDTRWRGLAHGILIFFILATYPVASVIGFAWLLILFALTQCSMNRDKKLIVFYAILFVLTHSFRLPFGEMRDVIF